MSKVKVTDQELIDTWLHHYIMPVLQEGVAIAMRGVEEYGSFEAMMEDGTDYDEWVSEACDTSTRELLEELKRKGFRDY